MTRRLLPFLAGGLLAAAAAGHPLFAQNFAGSGAGLNGAAMVPTTPTRPWHESLPEKRMFLEVHDGVLTVDGLTAKVHLNYNVENQGYLYFFMPGEGTAVVSLVNMSGSVEQTDVVHDKALAFSAGGHEFRLDNVTLGSLAFSKDGKQVKEKDRKLNVYVRFDRTAIALGRTPMFGYGNTTQSPYNWPYSLKQAADNTSHREAPPLPPSVLPRTMPELAVMNH